MARTKGSLNKIKNEKKITITITLKEKLYQELIIEGQVAGRKISAQIEHCLKIKNGGLEGMIITEKARAEHVLQQYENGGEFYNLLYKAVLKADLQNLADLYSGYPDLITAHCTNKGLKFTASIHAIHFE